MPKRIRNITGKNKFISDEELKEMLEKEYEETSYSAPQSVSEPLPTSKEILKATSGRAIPQMNKWI